MQWTRQAEETMSRVPFFIRKRVRKKVEEEAQRRGAPQVSLEHVLAAQRQFLHSMESEVKGHQVEHCFGASGCPNGIMEDEGLVQDLEAMLAGANLRQFLRERVQGPLKMHHEFRLSISSCPNACSRPQIVDVGLIGACRPAVSEAPCSGCGSCVEECREGAIVLHEGSRGPQIDEAKCVSCGQCVKACPSGALREGDRGYRILVGGKLGRHPQLGRPIGGIHVRADALKRVKRCLYHFLAHNRCGERFGEILERTGLEDLQE